MGYESVVDRLKVCALDALAIGIVITDSAARAVYANAAADRILSAPSGALRRCAGKVVAARCATQADLHALIARACGAGAPARAGGDHLLALATARHVPNVAICVLPVDVEHGGPANAMLLLRAIELECNLEIEARRLFGLTKSEAKFASALAGGLSLSEAAKAHAVSPGTARAHMKSIFRKTGVSRQSQVAALLRGAQIPLETRPDRGGRGPPEARALSA